MNGLDHQIRLRAFDWLQEQVSIHGDVLPRKLLEAGFKFEGERIPLVAPQGIFKPRFMELPLSITTTTGGPYDDSFGPDGLLLYRYRGKDPLHPENRGLVAAMENSIPLIYFHALVPGRYEAIWPVFIVGADPSSLTFKVAADDASVIYGTTTTMTVSDGAEARRAYLTVKARHRLHQKGFRERVLHAYQVQCALCRLRHYELLDAAHIIADREPEGVPAIHNGISLCKLHHAAFDAHMVGITPDYSVEIRPDILEEQDGPMLQHGLKDLNTLQILRPKNKEQWPDRVLLEIRYSKFKQAA